MTGRERRRRAALVAFASVSLVLAVAAVALRLASSAPAFAPAGPPLPAPERPAFLVPEPRLLTKTRSVTRSATVIRPVPVRNAPDAGASAISSLETLTPEGTTNVVVVTGSAQGPAGRLWLAVRIPGLPGSSRGWVPRDALGAYTFIPTHLVVDLRRLTAALMYNGRPIFRTNVGVGTALSPTPTGEFYIRSKVISFRSPFYGPLAFGTSARSNVLTDWPGGGFIGIHGTNHPELLPGRVSHGCIRMRNADILRLAKLMPIGTPLTIR